MDELRDILIHVPLLRAIPVCGLLFMSLTASAEVVDVRPVLIEKGGSLGVEYRSGTELVGRSTDAAPAGVELLGPNDFSAGRYSLCRFTNALGLPEGCFRFSLHTPRTQPFTPSNPVSPAAAKPPRAKRGWKVTRGDRFV